MNKATKWYAKPLYVIIALALVAGLTLVPVMVPALAPVAGPTVEASSVSGITVRMGNTTPRDSSNCTINFTTNVNLTRYVDTITIDFPSHTGATGNNTTVTNVTNLTTWVNTTGVALTIASAVTTGGTRVSITPNTNISAGIVKVVIGGTSSAPIRNPDPEGNYTLTVYTSQEPTPVTSSVYVIDSMIVVATQELTPTQVNSPVIFDITLDPTTGLVAGDTITIIFPNTTTVPATIESGANITINGTVLAAAANYTGNNTTKTVILGVPAYAGTDGFNVSFTKGAHLKNPITINSSYWKLWAYTSKDRGANQSNVAYSTTAGNQTQITQCNWTTHDDYIPNNTCGGSAFTLSTLDVNGAYATVAADTTFVLNAGNGGFYNDSSCSNAVGTASIDDGEHTSTDSYYYKSTVPGTETVTVRDLNASWTQANCTIIVNPMVQLWGGGAIYGNYTTLAAAEAVALPYDTIKVLPSTYGLDSTLTINVPHLTIESTGGADSTIIYGENGGARNYPIDINTHNVTIDGFTIKGNNTYLEGFGIYVRYGGFTIQNCKFIDQMRESIFVEAAAGAIANSLIHNNTCIGNGTGGQASRSAGIWLENYGNDISNITITNNTISNYGANNTTALCAYGIKLAQTAADAFTNITVAGNTITNCYRGFELWANFSFLNGTHAIANNTFSDCYVGVHITSAVDDSRANFTLQENAITNNTMYGIDWYRALNLTENQSQTIKYNDLSGNGVWGIYCPCEDVDAGYEPVASCNYWGGDETGPGNGTGTYASNATGSGSNVSINVTYSPWLNAPYPGGNSTYGSTINLTADWNFISVPMKLSNATFGFLLSGQNISASYSYDPGTGWTICNSSSPVEVLAGYWVDANAAGTINLTFVVTGQEVPASKDLTGKKWNAIGFSNITAATPQVTLESINASWSNVLGWNATNQAYDPAIIWPGTSGSMAPSKGYWVWMTANDTLAALS